MAEKQTTTDRIYAIIDAAEDDGQFGIPEDRLAAAKTIAAEIDRIASERDQAIALLRECAERLERNVNENEAMQAEIKRLRAKS